MALFKRTSFDNTDFQKLVALLDKDLAIRDGDEHAFYAQFNKIDSIRHVIVCYIDDKAAGIGGFKQYEPGKAEIKRMFVLPEYRGKGIALEILKQLENWAAETGFLECILETGKKQPEAISLYHKAGYNNIPNYGQYENVENSICMSKSIL
jgi:GNAT superfamily N-acetyltransferase